MRGDERKGRDLGRALVGEGGGGARREEKEGAWSKSKRESERGPSRGWRPFFNQEREKEKSKRG